MAVRLWAIALGIGGVALLAACNDEPATGFVADIMQDGAVTANEKAKTSELSDAAAVGQFGDGGTTVGSDAGRDIDATPGQMGPQEARPDGGVTLSDAGFDGGADWITMLPDAGTDAGADAGTGDAGDAGETDPWECTAGDRKSLLLSSSSGATLPGNIFGDLPFPFVTSSSGTVIVDGDHVYWIHLGRSDGSSSGGYNRSGLTARPRELVDGEETSVTIVEDLGHLTSHLFPAGDGYFYFVGGQDRIYRVGKTPGSTTEGPLASSGSQQWTGPIVMDEDAYYVASSEYANSEQRRYRILRIERANPDSRTTLWTALGDSNTFGEMALHQNDMAITQEHVYFSVRINSNGAPHPFQIYRLDKTGANQTASLMAEPEETYGGLATNGTHLYYFDGAGVQTELMELSLEPGATPEGLGIYSAPPLALSFNDGWLGLAGSVAGCVWCARS